VLKKQTIFLLFLLPTLLFSQSNFQLNREWGLNFEKEKNKIKNDTTPANAQDYSCFKPYIYQREHIDKKSPERKATNVWKRKIKQENLFIVNDSADMFYCTVDPIMNFEYGVDLKDKKHERLLKNTRGFIVRGDIGNKFSFETNLYENQATYAQYIDDNIAATNKLFPQSGNYLYNVVPGQGRAKAFKKNGYDFSMASGYVSYTPIKQVNIQVGHGKHFVGDGYRSLLLSDNAFNYPYARITTRIKNIEYTNLYTSFMNLTDGGVKTPPKTERLFQKKIGSFQMLSINLWKRLQIGLFQGMIWEAADSTNRQHVSFNTFNPIIGVNSAVYGLDNKHNIITGTTFKLKITNSISLYGQFVLDDLGKGTKNKSGYQIGFKYYDLFTLKNLHLQFEYNSVMPYTYAASVPYQSYTHYNQALAHPLGANFNEAIAIVNYSLKRFFIQLKANYAVKGNDTANYNYGGNVFNPDNAFPASQNISNISTTQGLKTTVVYQDFHLGYMINRSYNFNIIFGFINRSETSDIARKQMQYVYVGLRTSLSNVYYDF
jgi:Capsule assembly protein Wzi